ncbi:MAG: phosphosulfolactate synthase [bacterium]|nr:phosphosulfolactate synthase [bacterium]
MSAFSTRGTVSAIREGKIESAMETLNQRRAFGFIDIIERSQKPRTKGLTMVLDKGIGLSQAQDLVRAEEHIDIVKLGWGTPCLLSEESLKRKILLYKGHNIVVGNGGTLLEIAYHKGKTEAFFEYCLHIGLELIEVSNGVMPISAAEKAEIIRGAKDMGFQVISEVGKKDPAEDIMLSLQDRVAEAHSDLAAGAHYVIIEARETGRSLGVYDDKGGLKEDIARSLLDKIGSEQIMFEAPEKSQQAHLVMLFGPEVNLGNISPEDVIPLETLRRGLRSDTCRKI